MSSSDNNGLPRSSGNVFPLSEDDLPYFDQGERMFPSSSNGGTQHHASPTLPPPTMTLPMSRVERYKTVQAILASRHQDGNFVCAHVLEMKSYINKLDMMGVVFPREQEIDLVLFSLTESYSQFIEVFYMRYHDVTLINLTQS